MIVSFPSFSAALAIYESLPRSQSGSSARTHLVGIQSFSRSPSLARPSPPSREAAQGRYPAERGSSPVLYAQVDRSKKRPPVSTAPGETGSGGSPSDNGSTGNASPMDKEPLYATIGHKHKLSQLPPMWFIRYIVTVFLTTFVKLKMRGL